MTVYEHPRAAPRVPNWAMGVVAAAAVFLVAVSVRSGVAPPSELTVRTTGREEPAPASLDVAEAAPQTERLHGVRLIPIKKLTIRQCAGQARDAGFQIPCLGRLATGGVVTLCAGDCVTGGGYLWALRTIPSPPTSCGQCVPAVVVTAAPRAATRAALALTRCGSGQGSTTWRAFYCDQQTGPANTQVHAGHTMRRGVHGDIVFAVSAGGRSPAQRQLVNRVFEGLVFVGGTS